MTILAIQQAASWAALAFTGPLLRDAPLLLIGLHPTLTVMLVAGAVTPLPAALAVAAASQSIAAIPLFLLARLGGRRIPVNSRVIRVLNRPLHDPSMVRRLLLITLLTGNFAADIALGLGPASPWIFLAARIAGDVLDSAGILTAAHRLAGPVTPAVRWIVGHPWFVGTLVVSVVAVPTLFRRLLRRPERRPRRPADPS